MLDTHVLTVVIKYLFDTFDLELQFLILTLPDGLSKFRLSDVDLTFVYRWSPPTNKSCSGSVTMCVLTLQWFTVQPFVNCYVCVFLDFEMTQCQKTRY